MKTLLLVIALAGTVLVGSVGSQSVAYAQQPRSQHAQQSDIDQDRQQVEQGSEYIKKVFPVLATVAGIVIVVFLLLHLKSIFGR